MRANGRRDFLRSEYVVGTALSVDLMYWGGQFACGEGVREAYRRLKKHHARTLYAKRWVNIHWVAAGWGGGVDPALRR